MEWMPKGPPFRDDVTWISPIEAATHAIVVQGGWTDPVIEGVRMIADGTSGTPLRVIDGSRGEVARRALDWFRQLAHEEGPVFLKTVLSDEVNRLRLRAEWLSGNREDLGLYADFALPVLDEEVERAWEAFRGRFYDLVHGQRRDAALLAAEQLMHWIQDQVEDLYAPLESLRVSL